ncbi:hypothetical protein T5B8_10962 [Salinisphaera sp. T5B8]|uniref:hypothetical protein n=1 Tax=Salinisphaera sp. T5B8 TaxID=1304154 RepID=UPI003341EB48
MLYETIVSFILITLFGGLLADRWQRRSWLIKKRYEQLEYRCGDLEQLAQEIASLLTARIYHTKRIIKQLQSGNQLLDAEKYSASITDWNENLVSFYVRLNILTCYPDTIELEKKFQMRLRSVSEEISTYLSAHSVHSEKSLAQLAQETHSVQIDAQHFIAKLLSQAEEDRKAIGKGAKLKFEPSKFRYFTTFELFKALFVRDINRHTICRSPVDPTFPFDVRR